MSGLRAFCERACFLGSAWESSRALASPMIAICTSAFSVVHCVVGGIHSSCSSEASSKNAGAAPSVESCMIGRPPARRTSSYTACTSGSAVVVPRMTQTSPFFTLVE